MKEQKQNQKQQLEKQIGKLKRQLSSPESPIGDWKGIKQREYSEAGLPAPYSAEVMKDYYAKRYAVRKQINELEAQIAQLPSESDNANA